MSDKEKEFDIPNEIIVKISVDGTIYVAQKPKGVALTIEDMRVKDNPNFITHYEEDFWAKPIATFSGHEIISNSIISDCGG